MRILLVDDHVLFMQGLRFLLAELGDEIDCVAKSSCEEALACGPDSGFSLILLDWNMPGVSGASSFHAIRLAFPEVPIVIVSGEESPKIVREAIELGACGFVPKSSKSEVLTAALQLILAGGVYIPRSALIQQEDVNVIDNPLHELTKKQREVLLCAVKGKPNKLIARELLLSDSTVKAHLSAAFRALGVANRTEAVYATARLGLVSE